ncbi:MAG: hypothetical protein Q9175_001395, partial [Cornicularia normoerica]
DLCKDPPKKCSSVNNLNVACLREGPANWYGNSDISLVIVPGKITPNWLAEITYLVEFSGSKVMQLQRCYAYAGVRYKHVNAESINDGEQAYACMQQGCHSKARGRDYSEGKEDFEEAWQIRLKPRYRAELRYVCGYSGASRMEPFNDMAAMVEMIE